MRRPFLLLVQADQLLSDKTTSVADGERRNKVIPLSQSATPHGARHDQILQLVSHGEPGSGEVLPRLCRQVLRHTDARLCIRRLGGCAAVHDAKAAGNRHAATCHRTGCDLAPGHRESGAHSPDRGGGRKASSASHSSGDSLDGAPSRAGGDGDRGHQLALAQSGGSHGRVDAQHCTTSAFASRPRGADHRARAADRCRDACTRASCRTAASAHRRSAGGGGTEGRTSCERTHGSPVIAGQSPGRSAPP